MLWELLLPFATKTYTKTYTCMGNFDFGMIFIEASEVLQLAVDQ